MSRISIDYQNSDRYRLPKQYWELISLSEAHWEDLFVSFLHSYNLDRGYARSFIEMFRCHEKDLGIFEIEVLHAYAHVQLRSDTLMCAYSEIPVHDLEELRPELEREYAAVASKYGSNAHAFEPFATAMDHQITYEDIKFLFNPGFQIALTSKLRDVLKPILHPGSDSHLLWLENSSATPADFLEFGSQSDVYLACSSSDEINMNVGAPKNVIRLLPRPKS